MCKWLLKINGKRCFFAIRVSLFITNGQSGPVVELFALADANKRLNQLSSLGKVCSTVGIKATSHLA